jgi:hypothetical protein
VQALLLSTRANFFCRPEALAEGSLGACAPRDDTVGGCRPEPLYIVVPNEVRGRPFGDASPNEVSYGTASRTKRGMPRYSSVGRIRELFCTAPTHLIDFLRKEITILLKLIVGGNLSDV